MKNGNILCSSLDYYNFYILKLKQNKKFEIILELKGHNQWVINSVELINENLISISYHQIILWNKINNNIYNYYKLIN